MTLISWLPVPMVAQVKAQAPEHPKLSIDCNVKGLLKAPDSSWGVHARDATGTEPAGPARLTPSNINATTAALATSRRCLTPRISAHQTKASFDGALTSSAKTTDIALPHSTSSMGEAETSSRLRPKTIDCINTAIE